MSEAECKREEEKVVPVEPSPVYKAQSIGDKYDVEEDVLLGEGGFAKVVGGRVRGTGEAVAIKVMDKERLRGKKYTMMCHEREILRFARHPNIIHLHECIETDDRIYMIMDRMETDLYEYVKQRQQLSEASTSRIIGQVLRGVSYLHDNCIVHRDVKPENILLNSREEVRLADFGVAKILESWSVNATPIGTSYYMAPEVIRGIQLQGLKPRQTTREEVKFIDIWSTGVVSYILLSGMPPFFGTVRTKDEREALLTKIDMGVLFPASKWDHISDQAKDFVHKLLTVDTTERLTALKALRHPFIELTQSATRPAQSSPKSGAPTRNEIKSHLDTLIQTCGHHLDPDLEDSPKVAPQQAPPQQASEALAKPANPMKLRRSRRPPAS